MPAPLGPDAVGQRLAAIVESSDDAIISKNLDGIIMSWNQAAERIFGYTAQEAIGKSIRLIIPQDRQFEEDEVLARLRRGERMDHFETIRQRKDGSQFPISLTVSPVRDSTGTVVGASKIARDITERRQAEAAIEEARGAQAGLQAKLRALVDASGELLASPRLADVLSAIIAVTRRILPADGIAIWRLVEGAGWRMRAHSGVSPTFVESAVPRLYQGASAPPLSFYEPLIVEDVRTQAEVEERLAAYSAEGIRSMLVVPLRIRGEITGSLALYHRSMRSFPEAEVETARALGNIVAGALTTAELYDEQRRLRDGAAFLAQASTALAESLDLDATVRSIVELAVPTFADACAIHVRGEGDSIALASAMHVDPSKRTSMLLLASRPRPSPERGWGRTVREGTVELFEHIDAAAVRETLGDDPTLLAAFEDLALTSQLTVPMFGHGRLIGAITFALGAGTRRYTASDVYLAQDLARRCAIALLNAQLYEESERRQAEALRDQQRANFLADVGVSLANSLDYHETLRTLARLAVPRTADWCCVDMVADDGTIERLAVCHVDPDKVRLAELVATRYDNPESPYGVRAVIRTGQSVLLPQITDEMIDAAARGDEERVAMVRSLGLVSFMCVPMLSHGRAIGALTFVAGDSGRHFGDADLRFAEDVAGRAALAVENARAYEEARRANQVKDEFLATLSHELRTPLNAILGYARMLQSGVLRGDKQERAFGILERNATTLSQIVADILDVSRIVSGKLQLDVMPVDLTAVVGDALSTVLPAAEAKGVAIETAFEPQPVTALGDSDRLRQIVWNLVSNAVKFTPKGGRVDVAIEARNGHAAIVVADTGIGIQPEFLPHVFERFRQADSRFAREHGGLGLGLAIARHLVEMHGGTIRAASDGAGLGATFCVELPLVPTPADATLG